MTEKVPFVVDLAQIPDQGWRAFTREPKVEHIAPTPEEARTGLGVRLRRHYWVISEAGARIGATPAEMDLAARVVADDIELQDRQPVLEAY